MSVIGGTRDRHELRSKLARVLLDLRGARPSSADGRRAQTLAIRGVESTLRGVGSQIAFVENDSGNVEAATRDAVQSDRSLTRGARLLRAAGRAIGVRIGRVGGR